jgi:putative phosphoesterase
MVIALISDIHGNLPALKAVLKDAGNANAKQIWSLGDLVGYIPFPNECVELIRKKASASIVGNYDLKVIDFKQKEGEWKESKKQAKFDAFEWNNRSLNPRNQKYLRSLPQNIRRKIGKFEILLTHGSPLSIDEPVLPETPQGRLAELGKTAESDVIVMGHTHQFMNRKVGDRLFINPGSVGLPVKNDLRASYALLEISKDEVKVSERKIQYDISKVIQGLKKANLPDALLKMIKLDYGIDLENHLRTHSKKKKAYTSSPQQALKAVRRLAGKCDYEKQHSEHVALLALNLFDELKPLHKLTNKDRFLLNCAGILHDIGWIEGQKSHHKTAMKLILDSKQLPFPDNQRRMIALIARYHRKALPKASHPLFSQLTDKEKQKIRILAGILRIADGLDRTHTCAIQSVDCELSDDNILVRNKTSRPSDLEMDAASDKSDLLKQALGKDIQFAII